MTDANSSPKLQDLLAGAQLPALPQSAIRLLELSQDVENGPAEFAVPIETDPGLTGQVLRFVNSSYFGFSREISSIKLAITLVGIRTIKNFALWSAIFSLMPNPKCGPFCLKSLWQDSVRRGLFARAIGRILGLKEAEDLFAAALLQDMAIPLLAKELPEEYLELFQTRDDGQRRLSDLEQERFGWNHAQAAGIMARGWSLPEEFAELIEGHLNLEEYLAAGEPVGHLAVALSSSIPSAADDQWKERELFETAFSQLTSSYDVTLEQVFADVDAGLNEFAPMLKMATPSRPLVDFLNVTSDAEA